MEKLRIGQPEKPPHEVAANYVRWARKATLGLGGEPRDEMYGRIRDKSVAVVGTDLNGVFKKFDMQFPQASVRTLEEAALVAEIEGTIWDKRLLDAVRAGLLTPEDAERIRQAGGPEVRIQDHQRLLKSSGPKGTPEPQAEAGTPVAPAPALVQRQSAVPKGMIMVGATMMIATSCVSVPELPRTNNQQGQDNNEVPPESTKPSSTQTPETRITEETKSTASPEAVVTPTRPEFQPGAGGEYSEQMQTLIEQGYFKQQEEALAAWVGYWGNAQENPVHPDAIGNTLNFKYIEAIDYPDNPDKVLVALEPSGEDFDGALIYYPINTNTGEFRTQAPTVPNQPYNLAQGDNFLKLTSGDKGLQLVNIDGRFVRVDKEGVVKEAINLRGDWKEVFDPNYIADQMEIARTRGQESFNVIDPFGYEVTGSVVPTEVVEQGEWRWDLRGFTRTIERKGEQQLQVFRTLKAEGGVDRSKWLDVFDMLEAQTNTGPITVSVEGDFDALSTVPGFHGAGVAYPENWAIVNDSFWKEENVTDFTELNATINPLDFEDSNLPFDEKVSREVLVKGAGVSFILQPKHDESFIQDTFTDPDNPGSRIVGIAFKQTADFGRAIPQMYLYSYSAISKGIKGMDLTGLAYNYYGLGVWADMIRQGKGGLERTLSKYKNQNRFPWEDPGSQRANIKLVEALGAIGFDPLKRFALQNPIPLIDSEYNPW